MRYGNLTVNVDVAAGAHIPTAIIEMCALSNRLDVYVRAEMNGVRVIAQPGCDAQELCDDWSKAADSDDLYRIVVGRKQPRASQTKTEP